MNQSATAITLTMALAFSLSAKAQTPAAQAAAQAPQQAAPEAGKSDGSKAAGSRTLVELPATPMLDEEGRQRLDPEGKPMFNPPVRQLRDKHGHPMFDESGKPIMQGPGDMGYDEKGKKIHSKKEKSPKTVSVWIERGTLTVDGMTGKAGLNYEIKNLRFIYLYAPWIGVTVVSNSPFPGAKEQKGAFNDKTLTVTVEDHTLQLYSDKRLLGKNPEAAYVAVDRSFKLPSKFPMVGYGETLKPPYAWPGSRANGALAGTVSPPPLPESLRPATLLQPCPAGQMRVRGDRSTPGEDAPPPPCVAITKALPGGGTPPTTMETKPGAGATPPQR